jgi:CRISPR-associated endonuclease/helicase Cas3
MAVSRSAKTLWAKLARDGGETYLPLYIHMRDAAETAGLLWEHWLPHSLKTVIGDDWNEAERLFVFLAAAHDLGKATPLFQLGQRHASPVLRLVQSRILDCGLRLNTVENHPFPHALASQAILERHGAPRALALILGGHHGKPPSDADINDKIAYPRIWKNHTGFQDEAWTAVQDELYRYARELSGTSDGRPLPKPGVAAQALLSGLVIMADWIASGSELFPLMDLDGIPVNFSGRARAAWATLRLPPRMELPTEDEYAAFDLYDARFSGIERPHPVQIAAMQAALELNRPGIFIIEAPMGVGKTEAALVVAEILAAKTQRNGLYFALPTQATSDGIFPRIRDWAGKIHISGSPHSIVLAHGKSRFNEDYKGIRLAGPNVGDDGDEDLIVHTWLTGRKKSLLADFVVGTVDHVLMGALRQKHLALRHLGLAGKVVVIDECHAYDAYMNSYLHKMLQWLGTYGTPVVILSATLPAATRAGLVEAYLGKNFVSPKPVDPLSGTPAAGVSPPAWTSSRAYPLITCSEGGGVKQVLPAPGERRTEIEVRRIPDEHIRETLADLLSEGGCAGVIVNTVARAQEIAQRLEEEFGDDVVRLLHARFLAPERVRKEQELRDMLGPKGNRPKGREKLIVVGTQVLEQSLDVDFDVMITDICPMDLLLQRLGRLHRHPHVRTGKLSSAKCFVTGFAEGGFERGSEAVYGKYLLMNAAYLLPNRLVLPDDIPRLVQDAYAGNGVGIDSDEYRKAREKDKNGIVDKGRRATIFQIKKPKDCGSLIGWLDVSAGEGDPTGRRAEATVRDGADSIEVVVIQRKNGKYYVLPWLKDYGGREIPSEKPDDELAGTVAGCTVKLPRCLTYPAVINNTIQKFEKNNNMLPPDWQNSGYLKDELFLVLDEGFSFEMSGYLLKYDEKIGLTCTQCGSP